MTLHPCAHCRRHVALDSERCPFCYGAAPTAGATPRPRPSRRLPRSAMVMVASSALVIGCYEMVPAYGAPGDEFPVLDTGVDADDSGSTDTGVRDTGARDTGARDTGGSETGSDTGADSGTDTGLADTGGVGNLYGAPADVGGD